MTDMVLLTGATGFVGQHVLKSLSAIDVPVRAVVRKGKTNVINWPSGSEIVEVDDLFVQPASWWARTAAGTSRVLHLAWYAEPGEYLRSPQNLDCLAGTLSMAKGCAAAGVSRFVGVGTCFEYDTSVGYLSVNTPLKPKSPYAAAKTAAYLALEAFFREAGVSFAWCRLFYLYGAGEDPRRLMSYVRSQLSQGMPVLLTQGLQVRDYMDVEDAARELVNCLIGDNQGAVNVCSGHAVTVRALVESMADEFGRRDLLKFGSRAENFTDPATVVGIKD